MERILMKFGCTAGQAAAQAPLYTALAVYNVLVLLAALLMLLDAYGKLDRLGLLLGQALRRLLDSADERK